MALFLFLLEEYVLPDPVSQPKTSARSVVELDLRVLQMPAKISIFTQQTPWMKKIAYSVIIIEFFNFCFSVEL